MENKKNVVEPGKFVAYAYKVYDDTTGDLLFEAPKDAPDTMIYGVTQGVVPGLAATLQGLGDGDKFEVVLPPEAAFGPSYEENITDLDKNIFMRDGKLADEVEVGAILPLMTNTGMRLDGRVLEIGDDKVKIDLNHPLAGKTIRYEGEVIQVRDATKEEIDSENSHGCGGGCCGGGCGDGNCGDGGCSDGGCSDGGCGCNK